MQERVSKEWLDDNIMALESIAKSEMRGPYEQLIALTELRDRREEEERWDAITKQAIAESEAVHGNRG